jgi:hypothetical protein
VKICLEKVYDIYIFFVINGLCTFILHIQYTFVYIFLLYCLNFVKVCKEMCTNYDHFFLSVDINLNHNIKFYFLDYFSLLSFFFGIGSKCIFSLVLRYLKIFFC